MPIIGQYTISDVAKISSLLHERYGRIVRFSGLIGRPDLLFIYDADEIEKVSRLCTVNLPIGDKSTKWNLLKTCNTLDCTRRQQSIAIKYNNYLCR